MAAESFRTSVIAFDTSTWVASLAPTLAVYESGTPKGRSLAKQNLIRMAEVADLAFNAIRTIERMVADGSICNADVCFVMAEAKRLSNSKPCDNSPEHHVAPAPAGATSTACGVLAKALSKLDLPLEIGYSTRGFYIGTFCDAQPFTYESAEFWPQRELAVAALRNNTWTQRVTPYRASGGGI